MKHKLRTRKWPKQSFIPPTKLLRKFIWFHHFSSTVLSYSSNSSKNFSMFRSSSSAISEVIRIEAMKRQKMATFEDCSQIPKIVINFFETRGKWAWEANGQLQVKFPNVIFRIGFSIPNDSKILNIAKGEFSEFCGVTQKNMANSCR